MDCPSCVLSIEKGLKRLNGVNDARVNFLMGKVVVTYYPDKLDVPDLEKTIEDLGYRIAYKRYEGLIDKILKPFRRRKAEDVIYIRQVGDHDFDDLVLRSRKPVVVEFSSWDCPSCQALKRRLGEVAKKLRNVVYFYEMDIKTTRKWEDYDIFAVPTLLYFKGGQVVDRQDPLPEKEEVEKKIRDVLKG